MLSVVGWSAMLAEAESHLAEVQALIAALRPLAMAEAPDGSPAIAGILARSRPPAASHDGARSGAGRPANAPGRPPGRAEAAGKATGQPASRPLGRPPGPATIASRTVAIAGLGTAAAVGAVLAQGGPATAREVYERLTAAGWHARLGEAKRRHQVDVCLSSLRKRGTIRTIGPVKKGAGIGPRGASVFALAKPPAAAVAKLTEASARLGAEAAPINAKPRKPARKAAKRKAKRYSHYGRPRLQPDVPLTDRIAAILGAQPNRTAPEILAALIADGWQTTSADPLNIVRQSISTMANRKAIAINKTGTPFYYRLTAPAAKAAAKDAARKAKANGAEANNTPAAPAPASIADDPPTTTEH